MKKLSTKFLNNQTGFTLVEILVAGGLMVIVVGAVTASMTYQFDRSRVLQQKIETLELAQDLTRTLLEANNCDCMFTTGQTAPLNLQSAAGRDITGINLRRGCTGQAWLTPNSSLGGTQSGLIIQDITLKSPTQTIANLYSAELLITLSPGPQGMTHKPISIPQTFVTNAAGEIVSCAGLRHTAADSIARYCNSLVGAHFDVATGLCTIGTSTPTAGPTAGQAGSQCGPTLSGLVVHSGGTPQCLYVTGGGLSTTPL